MIFFFDNNMSPRLVAGLCGFGEQVEHLKDSFEANTPDEEWLRYVGNNGHILITRDQKIRKNIAELGAIRQYQVGAFILTPRKLNACDIIQLVVKHWPQIKETANRSERPFAYAINRQGVRFRNLIQ